ncbi:MAG: hypothetical protein ACQESP_07080 [Candidatus Muiribacteriota bacterium]
MKKLAFLLSIFFVLSLITSALQQPETFTRIEVNEIESEVLLNVSDNILALQSEGVPDNKFFYCNYKYFLKSYKYLENIPRYSYGSILFEFIETEIEMGNLEIFSSDFEKRDLMMNYEDITEIIALDELLFLELFNDFFNHNFGYMNSELLNKKFQIITDLIIEKTETIAIFKFTNIGEENSTGLNHQSIILVDINTNELIQFGMNGYWGI